ncbi:MAG: hypothetical protein Crog4KO_28770 [Crocinitomicaceae bacterium]
MSCKKEKVENLGPTVQYLHIGRMRGFTNPQIDPVAANINFDNYDMLWLGGDLAASSSMDMSTMNVLHDVFNLADPNTLWSLGNHDYHDLSLVQQYTLRPTSYTTHKNGITFLVLDTQDNYSNIDGSQLALFNSVMDTISESSHLVVLHHKLIWMYDHPVLESQINAISNGEFGSCFYCLNPNNFYTDLYPRLVDAEQSGIEVICVGGDIGAFTKTFEYRTLDGIDFLASGLFYLSEENKALVFTHYLERDSLVWEYRLTSEL